MGSTWEGRNLFAAGDGFAFAEETLENTETQRWEQRHTPAVYLQMAAFAATRMADGDRSLAS